MISVTIVRTIEAPPDAVFAAFVEPDKIALWWGPDDGPVHSADIDPRVGGRFHIRFHADEDGKDYGSSGVYEVFDPPRRLVMSWTWDDETGVASRVDVAFRAVAAGTEVTLVHSRLDDAKAPSHERGWNGAFAKLEARAGELSSMG